MLSAYFDATFAVPNAGSNDVMPSGSFSYKSKNFYRKLEMWCRQHGKEWKNSKLSFSAREIDKLKKTGGFHFKQEFKQLVQV